MEVKKKWWQVLLGGLVMDLSLIGVARGREKEGPSDPHDSMHEVFGLIGHVNEHPSLGGKSHNGKNPKRK